MDTDELNAKLQKVFNTYNVNILFCTHHLPCVVQQNQFDPNQMAAMQQRQMQLMQQQQ
jgi:hypothetical protein